MENITENVTLTLPIWRVLSRFVHRQPASLLNDCSLVVGHVHVALHVVVLSLRIVLNDMEHSH